MSLARLLEKKLDTNPNKRTIPITRMFYNDGSGMLDPMSTGKIINRMMSGGSSRGLGITSTDVWSLSSGERYALICAEKEKEQEALRKQTKSLSQMTPSTSLFGNTNNAIMHEKLDQSGTSLDYHHHNNFLTKPSPSGEKGYGGYMNLNLGGTPNTKVDMNKNVTHFGYTPEKLNDYKQSSNWLTQSGTRQEENLAGNLLNNFNFSDNFQPKKIKNNNLLEFLGK